MAYNYRCTDRRSCGARKTLKKQIERYIMVLLCPGCRKDTLKTVDAKEKARNTRRVCKCDGYHFPHHKGTEPWCTQAPKGPTETDYEERYR